MQILANPFLGTGISALPKATPWPSIDAGKPGALLQSCPAFHVTPLRGVPELAHASGIAKVTLKDERDRLNLGSFKALGAAYVIAADAVAKQMPELRHALAGTTYVTASAGNHGLSVASGAAIFGARAVVYLAESVPESFADRLRAKQAMVVRRGQTYEQSMAAAAEAARENGWQLLSDSSWPGYYDMPRRLMQGYLQIAKEVADEIADPPSHIFLQAGVGGFAGAMAAFFRHIWGRAPTIVVVEPQAAPALFASIAAGHPVVASGPSSSMGRLDCKEPSLIGLKGLARDADFFVTVSDAEVAGVLPLLAQTGSATTPSGAAGLAALVRARADGGDLRLSTHSSALVFITEEA